MCVYLSKIFGRLFQLAPITEQFEIFASWNLWLPVTLCFNENQVNFKISGTFNFPFPWRTVNDRLDKKRTKTDLNHWERKRGKWEVIGGCSFMILQWKRYSSIVRFLVYIRARLDKNGFRSITKTPQNIRSKTQTNKIFFLRNYKKSSIHLFLLIWKKNYLPFLVPTGIPTPLISSLTPLPVPRQRAIP